MGVSHVAAGLARGLAPGRPANVTRAAWDALSARPLPSRAFVDVGGEGAHAAAWNLNPSRLRTMPGGRVGDPIPRLIQGSGEQMPFRDGSISRLVLENAPITDRTAREIARVMAPDGLVELRNPLMGGARVLHRSVLDALGGVRYLQELLPGPDRSTAVVTRIRT